MPVLPEPTSTEFGLRLDQALAAKGWTQVRLAREAGAHTGSLSRMRSGARGLRTDPRTIFALADALGVEARWLFLGEGAPALGIEPRERVATLEQALRVIEQTSRSVLRGAGR